DSVPAVLPDDSVPAVLPERLGARSSDQLTRGPRSGAHLGGSGASALRARDLSLHLGVRSDPPLRLGGTEANLNIRPGARGHVAPPGGPRPAAPPCREAEACRPARGPECRRP
ncbi:unnamed protein product, partial [Staurois parvus]